MISAILKNILNVVDKYLLPTLLSFIVGMLFFGSLAFLGRDKEVEILEKKQ